MIDLIEKVKEEFGYVGKPKQWQLGFDALLHHLPDIIKYFNSISIKLYDATEDPDVLEYFIRKNIKV